MRRLSTRLRARRTAAAAGSCGQARARALMGDGAVEHLAVEAHRAGLVLQRAADAIDQRALARAVRPDQADAARPALTARSDAFERDEAAEPLAEISTCSSGLGHGACRPYASVSTRWRPTWPTGRCWMYLCTSPTMPFGATITNATTSRPDDQQIDRGGDRHGCDLLQRAEQDGADQRTDPARRAADQRHGNGVDPVVEAEGGAPAAR